VELVPSKNRAKSEASGFDRGVGTFHPGSSNYHLLREEGKEPGRAEDLHIEVDQADRSPKGPFLLCVYCNHQIAGRGDRMKVEGTHRHTFTNPHGIVFRIGCFSSAPGCLATGEESEQFAWFSGYSWQIALCGRCKIHLGWRFRSPGHAFHGLVLDRLVEREGPDLEH